MCRFLFLGDSITDCDHLWLPETNGLGNGYVSILAKKIKACHPDAKLMNKGIDGFTITALQQRLVSFVSNCKADMICLLIGINDLWLTSEQQFTQNYEHLLKSLRFLTNARILCIAPFIFPYPQEYLLWIPFIRFMERSISELAGKYQAECLLMQDTLCAAACLNSTAGNSIIVSNTPDYRLITTDGIHLTSYGHQILADAIWPFLYCE